MKSSQIVALAVVLLIIGGLVAAKSMGGKASPEAPSDATPGAVSQAPPAPPPAAEEANAASATQPAPNEPKKQADKALPTMLELGSVGCKPCEYMAPIIDSLSKELAGKVVVEFHDVNRDPTLADKYQIMVIPTQVFLDADGRELFRHTGVFEKPEILAKMRELGMLKE